MTVVVAGGMHDADTRGGLGHRRDWSPDPSACMGDAVEMDIASGVPGFYGCDCFLLNCLILKVNKFFIALRRRIRWRDAWLFLYIFISIFILKDKQ
ncbi:hypothetical protein F3G54_20100 [Pseudomonas aeruginosa]|jgi:hypothetical protein|nr:hypothetical protein F3G54_20100 [Pseudomonas aeruginosa]KAA5567228.1 hypothetical protein F3G51_06935 [Pseudomonas aeruginosa]KAA5691919.1 hypothetical protein F3G93_14215 [Pseudomonas aeruginosa]KPE28626.1 hypothetical protein AOA73_21795 [Pseudomonas aeruginosa]KPE32853.1 hypothetical protein AOA75_16675 [Pseudomonas aeruginosa]